MKPGSGSGSLVAKGQAEVAEREAEREAIRLYRREENRKRVRSKFLFDFYKDSFRYDPKERGYLPFEPIPKLEDWAPDERGMYFADVGHAPSSFTADGVRFICRWRYEGLGSDPAYWDDGWWPDWFVIVRRPYRWFPLLRHDVEVKVYGLASIAEALGG